MSRFDWDTYNATKDSPAGAVHATKTDWTDYLPGDDHVETEPAAPSIWQVLLAVGFVVALLLFFAFISTVI